MNNQPMYPYPYYSDLPPQYYWPYAAYGDPYAERDVEEEIYRPDDAEDAPPGPPPAQIPQAPAQFKSGVQGNQIRRMMCGCLGNWGYMGLRRPGRDFWFFPTEIRQNGVSGYTWNRGRRQKVSYRYNQIRNFMCFS
ncbi:hypothetical protein [Falsibacillus pallidus]|uniref:Uncharacterized protein n=1 Tax=Falsibacillus pallidus TaxID=493781 RepID=A0A370GPE7_9BACI|nr:hypothetical protein [Falsibacillus pallidus]RDI45615.1 hypothetical protein DFR59_102244 [Falsibacillus pallidus]